MIGSVSDGLTIAWQDDFFAVVGVLSLLAAIGLLAAFLLWERTTRRRLMARRQGNSTGQDDKSDTLGEV